MALGNACLWGTFEKLRKATVNVCRVCPSARIKQLDYHRTNVHRQ